jgi:pimeloyl-ACP methyl ester carboxylesterase
VRVRVVTDDGVGLEVEVRGAGPGLVLVHGFGGAKEDFADHVDTLATTHRVVTFDLRGHGSSDHPTEAAAYTLDRLALDLLCVVDALELETFRLLGHSMGGMVARRAVLAHPEHVDALILMDTSPGRVPDLDSALIDLAAELALNEGMDTLRQVLEEFSPLDTPAYLRLLEERPGYREFQDRKWEALSPVMWATLAREIDRQPDQTLLLGTIACPALVIVGELDENFVGPSEAMASAIPGAQLVVIPGAGHSPQFENPPPWIAALTAFLADVERRADPAA